MSDPMERDVDKILISAEDLARRVKELGAQISADYAGEPLMLVGILKGANIFMADLARAIPDRIQMEFMVVSSYGNGTESSGQIEILKDIRGDLKGKNILLVEDIIDTGLTLKSLQEYLNGRGAKSVRICTLLDKPERRKANVHVDYVGYEVPNEFIIGYGIDYAEYYRNLPYIASLKREVYEEG
jgi:hypoxanthine phosphoribosyltransferase